MIPAEWLATIKTLWADVWTFQSFHPFLFWGVIGSLAVNNGLRTTFKEYATRPSWARFIVAATDPLCGNFWRLLAWFSAKLSLPFKFPSGEDSGTISPTAIADAQKRLEETKP